MSLTLNDEQEKALRKWWAMRRRYEHEVTESETAALYSAIAPLFKPWRVSDGFLASADRFRWNLHGPTGVVATFLDSDDVCRVRDLLNEWEARR